MEPATLLAGLREHLAQRAPESERPVPGGQHRGAHAATAAITQQIGPRLGGLAVTVGERYQLLAAVGAHPDHHQQAQLLVVEAHVDMDAVSPQVHEVHTRQVPLGERLLPNAATTVLRAAGVMPQ